MRTLKLFSVIVVVTMIFIFSSCYNSNFSDKDFVHENYLHDVRLGDGVPLKLTFSVRWALEDGPYFYDQFDSADSFNLVVLRPRALELVKTISNQFPSVDSVFSTDRQLYISEIKSALKSELGEQGIVIKEIILSDVGFPASYTLSLIHI